MKKGEHAALYEHKKELIVVRWKDNANVTVLSNHSFIKPFSKAKRYDRTQKMNVDVDVPRLIKEYNLGMGGVDLDNALANYCVGIRGKKWWWPLFTNTLSNMLVNAWKLHCLVAKFENTTPLSQLQFRSQVARELLLPDKLADTQSSACRSNTKYCENTETKHILSKRIDGTPPRQCKVCSSKTPYICKKCDINLHPKCFEKYLKHK
ncbi:piggyBac transposable element-derived protein 3-like [Teleopsis dalmanni]|uniref:piggyBac transposable element-derived protein 3-like n=1 Tax=Teleopsis dalmanni TaxID=139649 RepID=UPI0018CE00BE|nr:piggyBac transposable element-derived protein 3-like [Teleopsis dalmanni]